ncbi:CPBP family intramembrane metalloprotease [Enterobacter hormaechei]|nr:CPBP family intramembrane metalloprotease [Enterobacter hormaechei]
MWLLSLLFTFVSLSYLSISINFSGLYIISLAESNLASLTIFTFFALVFVIVIASLTNSFIYRGTLPHLNSSAFAISIKSFYLWLLLGVALVLMSITLTFFFGGGELSIEKSSLIKSLYFSFIMALFPGVAEEVCFRWFFYGILKRYSKKFIAATLVGVVFSLLHFNQVNSVRDMVILMISGLSVNYLFCAIYERTGSIWPGVIFHVVWDVLSLNNIIHFSDGSPIDENNIFVITLHTQNDLITGGGFGFESSIFSVTIYLIAALAILYNFKKDQN